MAVDAALTVEEFNEWLRPEDALDDLRSAYVDPFIRKKWIMDRLKSGLIVAAARTIEIQGRHYQFGGVSSDLFKQCSEYGDDHFWETGDETFFVADREKIPMFDIRFDPESFGSHPPRIKRIDAMPPAPLKGLLIGDTTARNKGGRPRYDYWEPLLMEMARQLYTGDLQPKRQADIENAMHDWLTAHGHKGGETQVRQRAKSLWETIQK